MRQERKFCWVADHLHGTISLSRLEKLLVSTPEYNRLHNVLQNSTVYLTYPSNRTSRFMHSLGCAHVAGQMFRNAIVNADDTCLVEFWKEFRKQIIKLRESKQFKEEIAPNKLSLPATRLELPVLTKQFQDPFYCNELPSKLTQKHDRCAFVMLLQAIRFVGLLHDVGHPPFSHVSEYALGTLFEDLEGRNDKLNPREKVLLEQFRDLRQTNSHHQGKAPAFHEILGGKLSSRLLHSVISSAFEHADDITKVTGIYLRYLTLNILNDENPFYASLHSLIAGDIDADRIDYVLRDSIMSGYQTGSLQIDRLLKSYHLTCRKEQTLKNNTAISVTRATKLITIFEFMPSVRAVGVLEDMFKRRANLYRQVIYHHRVVKFDALLADCIVHLAHESLQNAVPKRKRKTNGDFLLPQDISGLWHVLASAVNVYSADRTNCYIQWDDAWLLSALRRRFMQMQVEEADPSEDKFFAKLQELLSNKKCYYSLFKRADGFRELEAIFLKRFPADFDWQAFIKQLEEAARPDARRLKHLIHPPKGESAQASRESPHAPPDNAPRNGFALVLLFRILTLTGTWGNHGLDIARQALIKLRDDEKLLDALLIRKHAKVGLNASQRLVTSTGFVRLDEVSTLVKELDEAAQCFPSFFVYLHPGSKIIDDKRLGELRERFGAILCDTFCSAVKDRATNLEFSFMRQTNQ